MAWESVAHLFAAKPAPIAEKQVPAWQFEIERNAKDVDAFLRAKGVINEGQTWRDAGLKALTRIEIDPAAFLAKVREWNKAELVEQWRDELGRLNVIIHCPLGYRVNRTWGAPESQLPERHDASDLDQGAQP